MSVPLINPATSDEALQIIVQQWATASDPEDVFTTATHNGFHALRFAAAVHKHMKANTDYSLFPQLVCVLEGGTGNIRINYLNFVATAILKDPSDFVLLKNLTVEQQNKIVPLLLEKTPKHIDVIEQVLNRPVSEQVVFATLCKSLNNLHQMKELSSRISSSSFLTQLSKVFEQNYPQGGVKSFAFWLAVPGYSLKMKAKEFLDFNNMIDFLDERTMDEKHLNVLGFAKRLLDMQHDTTALSTFIERAKILNALPEKPFAHNKRKM